MSDGRKHIERWFERVWHQQDTAAIHEQLRIDGTAAGLGAQVMTGPDDFAAFHRALLELVDDVRVTIDKHLEQGAWNSTTCTVRARCRKTERPVAMTGHVLARLDEGMIVESYNHFDFAGLFTQLGLLPEDWFATALSGRKVA